MAKISRYYGLILSPNMEMTTEGYLICKNVPICRSGTQDYLGSELEGFPGYQSTWNLDPGKKYLVMRPKEEVLDKDTVASFEGKTVTDTHPEAEGNVVTVDNDNDVNCGHVQNVKQGPDFGGLITLQGDLIIKNPQLIQKIRPAGDPEGGIRDVSCGYTLKLKRLADGALVMSHIRGNHVAVVEKGRAGSRIAIRDSAPPEIKPKEGIKMSIMDRIFGRGLKEYVAEASPEDLNELTTALNGHGAKVKISPAADGAVPVTPADPYRVAAHAALDRFMDARVAADESSVGGLRKSLNRFLGEEEKEPAHAADRKPHGEELEEGETAADDKGLASLKAVKDDDDDDKHAADDDDGKDHVAEDDAIKKPAAMDDDDDDKHAADDDDAADDTESYEKTHKIDNLGKSVLKAANDSVRNFIKISKPVVASYLAIPKSRRTIQQQAMIDSYNGAVCSLNLVGGRAYLNFTKVKTPEGIPAIATDNQPKVLTTCTCFDGVPYRVGMKRHQETCEKEGKK